MKTKILSITFILLLGIIFYFSVDNESIALSVADQQAQENAEDVRNIDKERAKAVTEKLASEKTEPRKIVFPKRPKPTVRYKCPIHGDVTDSTLTFKIDDINRIYCKRCAMKLAIDLLDLNTPKLEVTKNESSKVPVGQQ